MDVELGAAPALVQGVAEAARTYGVSQATVSRLVARYRRDCQAAFQPQS